MKLSAILLMLLLLSISTFPQTPQSFKYQAAVRDNSGNVLSNKAVTFRISILQGSANGTLVYSELHAKTTGNLGLVDLEIGKGSSPSGSFSSINWGAGYYFVKVEMDPAGGIAFQTLGTSQLLSVPYALMAKDVENVSTDATLTGSGNDASPLKIAPQSAVAGQVLKYSGSTWLPAKDISVGLILPYRDSTTVPNTASVFTITALGNTWSSGIRGVSRSNNGTGVVGEGPFGVFGYATDPGGTGVNGVNRSATGSGFGLSGVANSPQSGGVWALGGLYGISAVAESSSGYAVKANASNSSGTTYGVYGKVSSPAGFSGYFTGGRFHVNGRLGIGTENPSSGLHLNGSGFPESFLFLETATGQDAGLRIYEGSTAKWHLFNNAGAGGLQIYNSAGNTAIFCRQADSYVGIGTSSPSYRLQVGNAGDGSQARANAWNLLSDARLKRDFSLLNDPLEILKKINGYYFFWSEGVDHSRQIGFSAQEVREVLPEIVSQGSDGYLSVEYGKMTPLLLEAIKRLDAENISLRNRLEKLEKLAGAGTKKQ